MKNHLQGLFRDLFHIRVGYLLFTIIYFAPRIYTLTSHGPFTEPDSGGYRTHSNDFGFTNDLAAIDFFGFTFRPFPVNILYAILPNDVIRVLIQVILGYLAWIFLLTGLNKYKNSNLPKFVFVITVTVSPALIYRDLCILPDSISLTMFIGLIGLYLRELGKSTLRKILFFSLMTMIAIQRPTLWITFILFAGALLVISRKAKIQSVNFLILTLMVASSIGYLYNNNQSHNGWPNYFNTTYDVTKNAFPIGLVIWEDNPNRNKWISALNDFDFPACGKIKKSDAGPWEYSVRVFGECNDANDWLRDNFYRFFVVQTYRNPDLLLSQVLTEFPKAFVPSPDAFLFKSLVGSEVIPVFPTFGMAGLTRIDGWSYRIANNPFVVWAPLWILFLRRKMKNKILDKQPFVMLGVLAVPVIIGIIVNTIVMPSDTFRHNMPANYALLVMSLILVLDAPSRSKNSKKE